ncbi:hypothetical protein CAEBREN_13119 [Caenorhabditis brenneri]|uniref:Uncharacterized protein n=1 Tax=Caenorhabditis brenneri TaxID=135651 RepID=G0NTA7_CAEBE|nr:hypothetical protein CAEBREN_13119 [Caenorhabditis brenneri]
MEMNLVIIIDKQRLVLAFFAEIDQCYQGVVNKDLNPYIFTAEQFQIDLRVSDKQGEFSFKVVWSKYPGTCQMNMILSDHSGLAGYPTECVTTYSSPNKVMLVGFSLKDDLDVSLRQSAVFEGDSTNGKYLGNLYYARYQQIVSPSNKLTIYTFGLHKEFNYTLYMGMDIRAAGDVEVFQGMNCPSDPNKACYITLNSYFNVSAVATIGRQPDILKQFFQFPSESTLKIYEDQISDSNLLATIDKTNYMTKFPMEVKNSLKIYHLDTGRVSLPLAKTAAEAQYNSVFDGRFVNIHSFDYRRTSYDQDTTETFVTENKQQLYFKFNVKYFDVNGATSLAIKISKGGLVVYSDSFTASHMPPANTIKVLGDTMTVSYQTYGNYTQGFEVDLLTTKNDDVSSSSTSNPSITSSTVFTSTQSITLSSRSSSSPTKQTAASNTSMKSSTISDLPTTGQTSAPGGVTTTKVQPAPGGSTTTVPSVTRGTTERYESTTKSGMTPLSLVPLIWLTTVLLL